MTNKEKSLHHLHQARTAHIRWVNTIKLLVSGIDIPSDSIQLSPTDSLFGKWFYDEAMLFSMGVSRMVIEEIEESLLALHDKYMKIYPIYYGQKKKTLLGELLGTRSKASQHEIELSLHFYEEIVLLSDKLKHKLRILESQFLSMGEDKFDSIAGFTKSEISISNEINNDEENAYYYGTRGR